MQDTDKRDRGLQAFLEEQLLRYNMSKSELASVIAAERAEVPLMLFGSNLQYSGEDEEALKYRFPNELAALGAYARAAANLCSTRSSIGNLDKNMDFVNRIGRRNRSDKPNVKVKNKKPRNSSDDAHSQYLCDFVDVGTRLEKMSPEVLELLVMYYVRGKKAKVLAKEYKIDVSALGGRLSAAKRALRKVLDGMVPPAKRRSKSSADPKPRPAPLDDETLIGLKRAKVSKMLMNRYGRNGQKAS